MVAKIFDSEKIIENHNFEPGSLLSDGKKYLKVATNDGFINILALQLTGKKRLKIDELLRGYQFGNLL